MIAAAENAINNQEEVNLDYTIKNTNRAVGTMLSGVIAKKYGAQGLPDGTVNVKFKGSAGQSFGAFLTHGVSFKLEGETNDYPHHVRTLPPRTISLPEIRDSTELPRVNYISTERLANASECATLVPLPYWRVPVTTAVSI